MKTITIDIFKTSHKHVLDGYRGLDSATNKEKVTCYTDLDQLIQVSDFKQVDIILDVFGCEGKDIKACEGANTFYAKFRKWKSIKNKAEKIRKEAKDAGMTVAQYKAKLTEDAAAKKTEAESEDKEKQAAMSLNTYLMNIDTVQFIGLVTGIAKERKIVKELKKAL